MDFPQNRGPPGQRVSGTEADRVVKQEPEEAEEQRVNSSAQIGRVSVKEEAETSEIKREGEEEWTAGVKEEERTAGVKEEEESPLEIGSSADSPAEVEVDLEELGSESEESSEKRSGSRSKGRKRPHLVQHPPHRKVPELTEEDFELLRSMTGTPISYLANQPPLLIAVGENTYPLGSGLSYQIPAINMFSGPQDRSSS